MDKEQLIKNRICRFKQRFEQNRGVYGFGAEDFFKGMYYIFGVEEDESIDNSVPDGYEKLREYNDDDGSHGGKSIGIFKGLKKVNRNSGTSDGYYIAKRDDGNIYVIRKEIYYGGGGYVLKPLFILNDIENLHYDDDEDES